MCWSSCPGAWIDPSTRSSRWASLTAFRFTPPLEIQLVEQVRGWIAKIGLSPTAWMIHSATLASRA
jgi:hypothetical protein